MDRYIIWIILFATMIGFAVGMFAEQSVSVRHLDLAKLGLVRYEFFEPTCATPVWCVDGKPVEEE
ncbi:MAG: hypothetical protein WC373_17345 [Smithella sp.]